LKNVINIAFTVYTANTVFTVKALLKEPIFLAVMPNKTFALGIEVENPQRGTSEDLERIARPKGTPK